MYVILPDDVFFSFGSEQYGDFGESEGELKKTTSSSVENSKIDEPRLLFVLPVRTHINIFHTK